MRLPLSAGRFLARLSIWFVFFFLVWLRVGPAYTRFLAALSSVFISLLFRPTDVWGSGTTLFFWPRGFPVPTHPPAIAAEWIQANTVLLLALMAATPAPSRAKKAKRIALAFGLVLAWQVLDVCLAIQFGYATQLDPGSYSARARYVYALLTNLAMYVDTQVVPFVIWAGIHFRELVARLGAAAEDASRPGQRHPRARRR